MLKEKNIYYRWELPEGLSFTYKGKRQMIKSMEQMEYFMGNYKVGEEKAKTRKKN